MFETDEAEVLNEGEMSESTPDVESEPTPETDEGGETPETAPKEKETPALGDPNKLPPELQSHYKAMQASFTKKMQSLQAAVDAVMPHQETVKLFQRAMSGDPAAREQIRRIAGDAAPVEQKKSDAPEYPEQFESTKQLMEFLNGHFSKMIQSQMQQFQKPLEDIQMESMKKAADLEIDNCRKKFSDFDDRIDSIIEVRKKYPGLDLEASYKLATYQQKVPVQQTTAKPGTSAGKVVPKKKGSMTWEEAFEQAKAELDMK